MRSVAILVGLQLAAALAVPERADDGDNGDKGKAPKHKITQAESYVMVDPMYTTIIDGDRPVGMLMIGIGLDIPDAKLRAEAVHALPVLRDAFVRNLFNFSTTAVRPLAQPDVTLIADRLQAVSGQALGPQGAQGVLG